MPRAKLRISVNAPAGIVQVPDEGHQYVAVKTARNVGPDLPWTLAAAEYEPSLGEDELEVRPFTLGALSGQEVDVEVAYVDPLPLSRIVLSAPEPLYMKLAQLEREGGLTIPSGLIHQGDFLADLGCIVRACEPVDQGLVTHETAVAVICEPVLSDSPRDVDMDGQLSESLQSTLLSGNMMSENAAEASEFKSFTLQTLEQPICPLGVRPVSLPTDDLENAALLRVDQFARLGIFSGDTVMVKTAATGMRTIRVYSYPEPEPSWLGPELWVPPLLAFNLGMPDHIEIRAATTEESTLQEASDVVLSRISSPVSTNRIYQQSFLSGLRTYFKTKSRVVKGGDLIAVPIDTLLAQAFRGEEMPSSCRGVPNAVVWFRVEGNLPQSVFSSSRTRMVQSGLVQSAPPPTKLRWQRYFNLPEPFSYSTRAGFKYSSELENLLKASLTPRGSVLGTSVLLTSSRRGAGKVEVVKSVAGALGIHVMLLDCYEIVGDGDAKALGSLSSRLDRAAASSPCIVVLRHLEALAKVGDQDGRDAPLTSALVSVLDDALKKQGLVLAATTVDADTLSDSVRNRFKFEIDVTVPTENEREAIFNYLTATSGAIFDGKFGLRGDVSLKSLALQSAGLTPPDLVVIVRNASHAASQRFLALKDPNLKMSMLVGQRGVLKVTPADIDAAVSSARSNYSDAIGAPKIPKVGWKDVGGLEQVKGEIMDTIEMPLKYPQLFASGVKKRSGILFYGPPGTGKTLLAKAIATTFSLNFFSVKGPELLNMYIGESEANVRRVFLKARDAKPCVVFFDELDSVAPKRGNQGDSGGVMDRIVSQLLAELDGMSQGSDGVFVIGATNRPDLLDEALLRPGRFDKMLYLGVSDSHEKQRTILEALTRKFELAEDVDLEQVANKCPFTYTGADFYAMSSDAMLNAMTRTAAEVDTKVTTYNAEHPDSPLSTRAWFQNIATADDIRVQVTAADFFKALHELVPSVSADELEHYRRVRATFEGTQTEAKNGH